MAFQAVPWVTRCPPVFRVPERVAVQVPAVVTEAARYVGAASSPVPNMAKKTVVSAAVPPRLAKYHLAL